MSFFRFIVGNIWVKRCFLREPKSPLPTFLNCYLLGMYGLPLKWLITVSPNTFISSQDTVVQVCTELKQRPDSDEKKPQLSAQSIPPCSQPPDMVSTQNTQNRQGGRGSNKHKGGAHLPAEIAHFKVKLNQSQG